MSERNESQIVQNQIEEEEEDQMSPNMIGLREMCKVLDRSNVWIRRMVKEGRFESSVKVDGEWRIDEEEVLEYLEVIKEREERYELKKKGEFTYPYTRPSKTSIRMITKKVKEDDDLDDSTKQAFLDALSKYDDEYEEAYLERKSK